MVIKRQRLLSVARIFGVIQVENQTFGRTGKAGDELFHERLADTVNIPAVRGVFEARNRRSGRQRGISVERQARRAKLEHRLVAQAAQ